MGSAAALLWLVPAARRPVAAADWPRLAALSVVWVAAPFTIFPIAQQWVNSALTGMLNGAMPIFAAGVATLLMRRVPRRVRLVGLVLGFAGVTVIARTSAAQGASSAVGVALILAATLCYGVAVNLAVPLQRRYGSLPVVARMLALATAWTAPFGIISLPASSFALPSLLAVLAVGLLGTAAAYLIMGTLVGRVGSVRASFITYLIPVVALFLGVLLRGDRVGTPAIAGVVLATAGALLAARREH